MFQNIGYVTYALKKKPVYASHHTLCFLLMFYQWNAAEIVFWLCQLKYQKQSLTIRDKISHKATWTGKALPLFNQNVVRGRWRSYSIQHTTDTHKVHHTDSRITKKYKLSQVNKGRINLTLHTAWVMSSTVRTKYMSPMLLWFLMLKIPRAASSTILYVSWPLGVSCKDANLLWLQILKEMIAYNNSNGNWDVFYKIHMISKMVSSSRTHLARSCLVSRRS